MSWTTPAVPDSDLELVLVRVVPYRAIPERIDVWNERRTPLRAQIVPCRCCQRARAPGQAGGSESQDERSQRGHRLPRKFARLPQDDHGEQLRACRAPSPFEDLNYATR